MPSSSHRLPRPPHLTRPPHLLRPLVLLVARACCVSAPSARMETTVEGMKFMGSLAVGAISDKLETAANQAREGASLAKERAASLQSEVVASAARASRAKKA